MSSTSSQTRSPVIASWILLIGTCLLAMVPFIGFLAWIIGGVTVLIAIILGIVVISKGGTWHGVFILVAALVIVPVIIFFGPIISSAIAGSAIEASDPDSSSLIEKTTDPLTSEPEVNDPAGSGESSLDAASEAGSSTANESEAATPGDAPR